MTRTRLAAGPLGPSSTFGTRRGQKVRSAAAIIAACRAVLEAGEHRPSIRKVLDNGSGFSETTLNRKRYKPILHAAQQRFDARANGEWAEGDEDWFASMEMLVAEGYWVKPEKPSDATDPAEADLDTGADPLGASAADDPAEPAQLSPLEAENAELRARLGRLEAEIVRRDGQLYHALQTCQLQSRTIRRQRQVIASLNDEIDTIQTEPWDPREQGQWLDEKGGEDWPENQ